ncbi:MAG: nickel-responsive transcriptional regulator NikR [Nitrospiraceae bacterium]|nr:nickel-responsive transcriptional regulator NikR [Nitrospiraceae bacterium]MDA8325958.1 nickel-responsive transcriptional regulator NikR [Nitrospiraceae bacterium]
MGIVRFGISLEGNLLKNFDRLIGGKGYSSRSEAIRDLIRDALVKKQWEGGTAQAVATVTLVYDHHTRELSDTLTDLQHKFHKEILSSMHVHLDAHNCLEVVVLKGPGRDLQAISDRLIGTRGVKHGRLTITTTGKGLE